MNPIIIKLLLIISLVISISNIMNNIEDLSIIGVNLLYIMLILQHSLIIKYNVKNIEHIRFLKYFNKSIPFILLIFMLMTHPWFNKNLIYKFNILLIILVYFYDICGIDLKLLNTFKWKNKIYDFLFIVNIIKVLFLFLSRPLFLEQFTVIAINTILSTIVYYYDPLNYYEKWNKLMSFAPIYSGFL